MSPVGNTMENAAPAIWALPRARRPLLAQALGMALDPEGFFAACAEKRGDPFVVRLPSVGEVLVSGHPDGARELFSLDGDSVEPLEMNPVEPLLGSHSLLLLSGERHRRERRLMTPPFHGDRMRAYGAIIRDRTLELARSWRPGQRIVAQQAMRAVTLDVILRAVLGVEGDARSARFRAGIAEVLAAYTPPLLVVPALRRSFGPFGPWARFARAREAICALFLEEIGDRRREARTDRIDILSLLMAARYDDGSALSDAELVDELRTLIVGGHDTTTTALAWAIFHVHRDPAILARLRAEVRALEASPSGLTPEALAELPYLGAVCNEALRLHPVVPIVPRRARRALSFRGQPVSAGQNVAVATTLLHTHPEVWTDPHRFDPERFLGRKYSPFEYAPFGGGARRCIGAAFGAFQMRVVLGTLIGATSLTLVDRRSPARVLMNITMGPREAIELDVAGG
jgi:cytochrome P450